MKLVIDTEGKTVEIIGESNLKTFQKELEEFLPKHKWEDYTINFTKEILDFPYVPNHYPHSPITPPWDSQPYYTSPVYYTKHTWSE